MNESKSPADGGIVAPKTKKPAKPAPMSLGIVGLCVALVVGFIGWATPRYVEVDPIVVKKAVEKAISDRGLVTVEEMNATVAKATAGTTTTPTEPGADGTTPPAPATTDNADPLATYRQGGTTTDASDPLVKYRQGQ